MKKTITALMTAGAVLTAGLTSLPALAHGNVSCTVPRKERQPSVKLQQQLKEAGWKIQKIQVYYGCYEVYGFDENGKKVEAFFDPRTLQRIEADG